jgi:hypothetical protein
MSCDLLIQIPCVVHNLEPPLGILYKIKGLYLLVRDRILRKPNKKGENPIFGIFP